MKEKIKYENAKEKLLNDESICKENRLFFAEFFEKEEYKLKRMNGLRTMDKGTYKTVYYYITKFRSVNKWFKNKPWKDITKSDFKKFYDDFEDGKILKECGKPYEERKGFYSKIFRSKPFEMLGKTQMVAEVMEFHQNKQKEDVRFIDEIEFRKIISVIANPSHKLVVWLAWDIGENINSLLQLKKDDFNRQVDKDTTIAEYIVNLREETLKRTRRARSEITNFPETVELLDIVLPKLKKDDPLFKFEYRNAKKFLDRAVKITGVKCKPKGENVTWKDLRSSMSCDLLKKGWNCDEVNSRLGHRPSSREIDRYINFLALDRHKPKQKIYQNKIDSVQGELEKAKEREKLSNMRLESLQKDMGKIQKQFEIIAKTIIKKKKPTIKEVKNAIEAKKK